MEEGLAVGFAVGFVSLEVPEEEVPELPEYEPEVPELPEYEPEDEAVAPVVVVGRGGTVGDPMVEDAVTRLVTVPNSN